MTEIVVYHVIKLYFSNAKQLLGYFVACLCLHLRIYKHIFYNVFFFLCVLCFYAAALFMFRVFNLHFTR